ncbi:MAG: helicase-exonuclease AddAB subunit AddA [Oscillospiraceae bacterium]|nr:helicase-exonuclease AddAB subunit AddA [Candidatus Ruminococcus equi]
MSREWTPAQKNAIEVSGGSVVVSAAAGSGKTAVLVERAIRMITDVENPIPVDRILIVTYTRDAAAQLKERLTIALNELLKKNPTDANLLRQKALLPKANISTIDSFCSSIVKEYFYKLDIDRNFRIADDSELDSIKADAMKLTLDTLYTEGEESFFELVEAFASHRDDVKLQKCILKIHEFLRSHPFEKKWMNEKLKMYDDFSNVALSPWGKIIFDYTHDATEYLKSLIAHTKEVISDDENLLSILRVVEDDNNFLEKLIECEKSKAWDEMHDILCDFSPKRFPTVKNATNNPKKILAKENRDNFKKIVDKLKELFSSTEEEFKNDIKLQKGVAEEMFRCVRLFSENFAMLKASKKIADYADLEHFALSLLVDEETLSCTDIAFDIRKRFDRIMVDEYQDANEVQDTIFKAISNDEENLFVVGDVKQSIYGFRQAMPEIFIGRKERADKYDKENPTFPTKIILEKNFRSAKDITNAVNFFFRNLMSESVGDIEYNSDEELVYQAEYDSDTLPQTEVDILDLTALSEEDLAVAEAKVIAERILELVSKKYPVKDGDTYRPIEFSDFAVLMRSKKVSDIYVKTLTECAIPAYCDNTAEFTTTKEIMIATNLLRVIDNPMLDIELLSVMLSPLYGFTPDDLVRIRLDNRHTTLYNAVLFDAENGNEKSKEFVEELAYFRRLASTLSLSKLINTIYEKTGILSIYSATDYTDVKKNNLLLLMSYARDFEQNTHKGLSSFVLHLDKINESKSEMKGAVELSRAEQNAVRVMSIHASKGLEFPVCFVANTSRKLVTDTSDSVLLDSKTGFAVKRKDTETGAVYDTALRKALALRMKQNEMSEELRILYVAMTRAKQKLILVSSHKDVGKYLQKMALKLVGGKEISPYIVRTVDKFSDWIAMCSLLHKDGIELRAKSETVLTPLDTDFNMDIKTVTECIFCNHDEEEEEQEQQISTAESTENDLKLILEKRKSFVYPYAGMLNLPSKVSASELSHKMSDKAFDRILRTPAFVNDKKLSGAEKGTALHAFLQFSDFESARKDFGGELQKLKEKGYLTELQAENIDKEKAKAFIESDVVERVLKSEKVFREYRFSTYISASAINHEIDEKFKDEKVILQGAVDLAFVEDGELVIIDYKTDRVKDASSLLDMYEGQLLLYKDAMEECTEYKVKECLIYSIHLGKEIKVC